LPSFRYEYTEQFSDSVVIEAEDEDAADMIFWYYRFADHVEVDEVTEIS